MLNENLLCILIMLDRDLSSKEVNDWARVWKKIFRIHSHINFCSIESKSQNEYCWIVWWHCDICLSIQFPLIKLAKFNWRKVSGNDRVLWGKKVVVNENQVSYISLHFILGFFWKKKYFKDIIFVLFCKSTRFCLICVKIVNIHIHTTL